MPRQNQNNILAIDSTTETSSIALYNDKQLILQKPECTGNEKNSAILLPQLHSLLKKQHLCLKQIQCIAITHGPGSFIGVRTGILFAKAINLVHKTPIRTFCTLQTMATWFHQTFNHQYVISAIDARMEANYIACYQMQPFKVIVPPSLVKTTQIKKLPNISKHKWHVLGSGALHVQNAIPQYIQEKTTYASQPAQAGTLVALVRQQLEGTLNHHQVQANYLRNNVAQAPKNLNFKNTTTL